MSQDDPHVVVVDDVEINVVLLRRMLASFGITSVTSTCDPRQAVELVRSSGADLVLLDLHMPGMSGLDVLAALRAVSPEDDYLPVIVLSADESREAREAALRGGAQDFVSKPFDGTEVELRVRNVLRTRGLYQELRQHTAALQEQVRHQQEQEQALATQRREATDRVRAVLDDATLRMHFQPIVGLADGRLLGVEALARFEVEPRRTPDVWFAEAASVGLGVELEQAAVTAALAQLPALPSACYVSVNLSAEAVMAPGTLELLTAVAPERLVVELTEHTEVADYGALTQQLAALRAAGVRLAVDDTGAGFASLRHILQLHPDVIKLDLALTRDVDTDPARRALAAALITFAGEIGAAVVAEGVETAGELTALRELRVDAVQGYYLGRPQPLPLDEVRSEALPWQAHPQKRAVTTLGL